MVDVPFDRVIAIGDIHGCVFALDALVDALAPGPRDVVVSLGDYVDTGGHTRQVIDTLLQLSARCRLVTLMGNHEEMLLAAIDSEEVRESWLLAGGVSTLNSYWLGADVSAIPQEHLQFIRSGVDSFETDDCAFVHANYDPQLPFSRQPGYLLRWSLLDRADAKPHVSGKRVVVGHTEQRQGEILDLGFAACIDTYCYGTGWLTALDVTEGLVWQANRWGVLRDSVPLSVGRPNLPW